MEELRNPHSYDFNKDGIIPRICNNCGLCNDIEHKIPDRNIIKTRFSNHFIENLLEILCNNQRNFTYRDKKLIFKNLVNRNISCSYNLAELIILEAKQLDINLRWDFVIYTIYSKSGAYLSINSYV